MLTFTLRGLERDGLVTRTVFPTTPPRVDYELERPYCRSSRPLASRGIVVKSDVSTRRPFVGRRTRALDIMVHIHHYIAMKTKRQTAGTLHSLVGEVTTHCLMTRARRISRVVTNLFDQEMRPFGINSSQFTLLVMIARMEGASRAEIGRANYQERSTSTRNLQLVLDQGWAEEIVPEKGRSRPIVISQSGRDLLAAAMPAWRAAQAKAKRLLGDSGAEALVDLASSLPIDSAVG